MAPPPEYDKEPKAPDKNVTTTCSDDSKVLYNIVKDHLANQDHKGPVTTGSTEAENKHIETLDDGQLRALLDEAITYKCPKDREGKSSLFKELLHEVEQDEQQACEAARGLSAGRAGRRGGARGRRELQSNSLQDLVAAMAAEPAPRRPRAHHPPAQVSARAHHGGSLPSGVDTSFLLSEEPTASRGGYLATVRCVNPPPLAERRVSASDANGPADVDLLARRSKPTFPMTYTARATLEIGSGSVCSGRAVTTTTASNQVRTTPPRNHRTHRNHHQPLHHSPQVSGQMKLMNAICPMTERYDARHIADGGGINYEDQSINHEDQSGPRSKGLKNGVPRGQNQSTNHNKYSKHNLSNHNMAPKNESMNQQWVNNINNWYESLNEIRPLLNSFLSTKVTPRVTENSVPSNIRNSSSPVEKISDIQHKSGSNHFANNTHSEYLNSKEPEIQHKIGRKPIHSVLDDEYNYVDIDNEIILRKKYRERVGYDLLPPHSISPNPDNFRKTTIGIKNVSLFPSSNNVTNNANKTNKNIAFHENNDILRKENGIETPVEKLAAEKDESNDIFKTACVSSKLVQNESIELQCLEINDVKTPHKSKSAKLDTSLVPKPSPINNDTNCDLNTKYKSSPIEIENEIELTDIQPCNGDNKNSDDFLKHLVTQQRFLNSLENETNIAHIENGTEQQHSQESIVTNKIQLEQKEETEVNTSDNGCTNISTFNENIIDLTENREKFVFAELPYNAYVFLTQPHSLFPLSQKFNQPVLLKEIENNNNITPYTSGATKTVAKKSRKKSKHKKESPSITEKNANNQNAVNKSALKLLLYSDSPDKSAKGMSDNSNKKVDSAIPFTCITTPEVVASCNTTSSTSAAVAVDPKPLQLGSCYRAVASLTGEWTPPDAPPAADPAPAAAPGPAAPAAVPALATALATAAHLQQPRSVISSSFNGLPLSRPNYGSTATSTTDEYKVPILTVHYRLQKSLDENGNAVQGFSSPLSGSSQHKKPRRKKSSKNETVIKSHQIDGYQGNKDLNEVLRFIESNADTARGHKLGRAKHKDDSDDKGGKKRSTERRKDKENKIKRASSLEELSRTKLEDLTDEPEPRAQPWPEPAPAKPERRSWGDDSRDTFYFRDHDAPDPAAAELTDFQTVTKKRKPRRRHDDAAADPPRRARAPSPRRAPSDRSNDSNDDLDSVHSLPADAAARPPPAPHASYADIARTRHNIPDLIESCNFYGEGEAGGAPPADGDYPALAALAARRARDKPAATPARGRKERVEPAAAPPAPPPHAALPAHPAPDVLGERRPPVVLLDAAARAPDMDGVTFGFDVNEQLVGAAPRARCDLVRDAAAAEGAGAEAGAGAGAGAVAVRAGGAALRYVPPRAPAPQPDRLLLQLVDYVGAAWEDVVRCGGGKVRYFSE